MNRPPLCTFTARILEISYKYITPACTSTASGVLFVMFILNALLKIDHKSPAVCVEIVDFKYLLHYYSKIQFCIARKYSSVLKHIKLLEIKKILLIYLLSLKPQGCYKLSENTFGIICLNYFRKYRIDNKDLRYKTSEGFIILTKYNLVMKHVNSSYTLSCICIQIYLHSYCTYILAKDDS